jgi:ligand-binding sensor domain-containing protein/two-component sensor histidine kinase
MNRLIKQNSKYRFPFKKIYFVILILISLVFLHIANAQTPLIKFEHIQSDEGLSQNTIHFIIQDSKGFLWFATEDGLNKYDGYNFTVYKNNPADKNSLSDNFIWTIYEDKHGIIWVGTNSGGLNKFDRVTEKFISYKHDPSNPNSLGSNNVRAIKEDRNGFLWVATEGGGLNKLDKKNGKFTRYLHNPNDNYSLSNNTVLSLYEDEAGTLWVGSDGGLDKFLINEERFIRYPASNTNPNSLSNSVVLSIYEDKSGMLWIGTIRGLNSFDRKKGEFTRYIKGSNFNGSITGNRINSILEDRTGVLWVGTGGGLFKFDRQKQSFIDLQPSFPSRSNLIYNVLSVFEDNSGLIWIGTAEGGIIKYNSNKMKFITYEHNPNNPNSLSYNTVRAIHEDKAGNLWIGTLGGGLNLFDREKNRFIHYKSVLNNNTSLSDNTVTSIFETKDGFMWVGTWGGGLNKLDRMRKSFTHFRFDPGSPNKLSSDIVQVIFEDSRGYLWIGTGDGLDLYDSKQNKFFLYTFNPNDSTSISSRQVQSCMIEDNSHNLWVGTWDGLNKIEARELVEYSPGDKINFIRFQHHSNGENSLSDNRVISLYEDRTGIIWVGTHGGGLNKLTILPQETDNKSKYQFKNYSVNDGLASNIIYGILEDNEGNLWLSTDNGLSKFNPTANSFRNYYESDGLQSNRFFWGASKKSRKGELIFGGTNGFNIFYAEDLKDNLHIPPIVITDFQIFNRPVEIGAEDSPLKHSITETKELRLSYDQNVISFEFAALDYTIPSKNQYAYILEGFEEDWNYSGKRRFVSYTNLSPGEYIFKVKGSNNDGIWNETGTAIKIVITPPFWKTWWFILISTAILAGLIILFVTYRVKYLLGIERLRLKLAADLHDNIGSSLTEISILSEVISKQIKNEDDDIIKSLNSISNKSRQLVDNMSDIVWLVNPKRDSLYDLIIRLRDTYTELSSFAAISFKSENLKSLEKVSLSMEHRQHLYLIFKEGINNSITHSRCTEISLNAFIRGKKLEMILSDNGNGFDLNIITDGNGLGNMKERAEIIGGKLTVSSQKGKGTVVRFSGNIL